jgi:crotonobetainyl-CoA:carnitine CoA-transferase CaiB-like acyl-CoA transferase
MPSAGEGEHLVANLFSDLHVLDIASFIAGPAATTILSDFGAEVIKVEVPGTGDPYRMLSQVLPNPTSPQNYMWQLTNRNKRSITVNLKHPQSQEILRKLVTWADVLVVNFPPHVRTELHLTYPEVAALNPRLIYADITGYGEEGPDANEPGFDITAYWARTGLMDTTRNAGSPPTLSAPGIGDQATAMTLYASILTGLYRREKTGKGCHAATSLIAEGTWAAAAWIQAALDGATFYGNVDRRHPPNAVVNTYPTSDNRWILVDAEGEKWFTGLATALGHSEWVTDDRFASEQGRSNNADLLTHLIEEAFAARDVAYWRTALSQAQIPFSVVQTIEEAAHDPQLLANHYLVPIVDGAEQPHLTVDSPVHVAEEAKVPPRLAPTLGQHTSEILKELAYDDQAIAALRKNGVV